MAWCYQSKWIECGRKCRGCPHGPYWYRCRKKEGKTRWEYVGNCLWAEGDEWASPPEEAPADDRDRIFDDRRADAALARRILGVGPAAGLPEIKEVYKRLCLEHHPDRGGDRLTMSRINAAYAYLRAALA